MHILPLITAVEKCTLFLDSTLNFDKVGGACLLEECVKDNYYARFHLHSYHCCREMNFISRLDTKY